LFHQILVVPLNLQRLLNSFCFDWFFRRMVSV
jgi:hypothetical protein